ncbi:hypothetical protein ACH47B_06455 [Rhodococcus sp. NPDC019627]|uniref:hypothetical protein n=1 Tax=unclassified Rhodococcus (in: high G+C Gram-positive bacteria) TaxID=192944 RepID=UPI0037B11ABB
MELPPNPRADVADDQAHVQITVLLPDGTRETLSRRTTEPDNPMMLRRLLRGAAAELDQRIAGMTTNPNA